MNRGTMILLFVLSMSFSTAQLHIVMPQSSPTFIYDNSTLQTNVFVKNTTDKFMRIVRIETSCGCVKASVSQEWLSPNATARIKVVVVPPFAKKIRQTWYIKIYTNASNDGTTVFINAYTINRSTIQNRAKDIVKFIKVFSWIILF